MESANKKKKSLTMPLFPIIFYVKATPYSYYLPYVTAYGARNLKSGHRSDFTPFPFVRPRHHTTRHLEPFETAGMFNIQPFSDWILCSLAFSFPACVPLFLLLFFRDPHGYRETPNRWICFAWKTTCPIPRLITCVNQDAEGSEKNLTSCRIFMSFDNPCYQHAIRTRSTP